jgi:hypothetical protein
VKTLSQELAGAAYVEPICRTFGGQDWQDLRQDLFLYCAVEHAERAELARQNGCLEYFYLRCAINHTRARGRSNIHATRLPTEYLNEYHELIPDTPPDLHEGEDATLQSVGAVYAGLDWYERKLIDLFLSGWSVRKISRQTGITDKEIRRVVRLFRGRVLAGL